MWTFISNKKKQQLKNKYISVAWTFASFIEQNWFILIIGTLIEHVLAYPNKNSFVLIIIIKETPNP